MYKFFWLDIWNIWTYAYLCPKSEIYTLCSPYHSKSDLDIGSATGLPNYGVSVTFLPQEMFRLLAFFLLGNL